MVFESVITEVLNKTLGNFVENLDTNQLKLGIWNGDVVLNNLKLKENILDDLDLPIQLVYGYLGKLVLNIPWKNLYTKPVVAQIEDFYILIAPKQSIKYDELKEETYELQAKQTHLQKIEDAKKQEMDKPQQDKGFVEKLTAQIINNLQVKITNVHIRYEDISTTENPFSFGITLYGLEIYTADTNWEACYMTEQVSKVFKVANLDSLSVYMNCSNANLFRKYDISEYSSLFKSNIAFGNHRPNQYVYMIGPISLRAQLKLNMNPQYDNPPFQDAKIELDITMQKLNIGITRTQFQDILKLGDAMNRMQLGLPYRKYRPYNIPYKNHYKEWWHFAITSVLEENVRRKLRSWRWQNIKIHRNLCTTYANAFKEKQLSKKVPANIIEACNLCEKKLDLFNLILIRNRVHLEIDKFRKEEEKRDERKSWFGSWWSKGQVEEQNTNDIVKKFEAAMTPQEKKKLYDAIGYNENTTEFTLPIEYEAIKMNFQLIALEIGVFDDIKNSNDEIVELKNMLLLNFALATCEVIQRPAANAIKIIAGMKEMKLTGLKKDNFYPILIESVVLEELNLFDIFFESNPIDKKCDRRIRVSARPLQIVYDSETILELLRIFSPASSVNLSEFEGAASEQISSFKERSATGIQYVIDKHEVLEINIQFMPNILILPRYGLYNKGYSSAIIVSLGKLTISSAPCQSKQYVQDMFKTGQNRNDILKNMMVQAYDKFQISIDDVQILVGKPKEKWLEVISNNTFTDMHVLLPTSFSIAVDLCVINDDPRLPKTKVEILLPLINISLTEDRILEAITVITSIPLPESNNMEPMPLPKTTSFASRFFEPDNQNKLINLKSNDDLTPEIVQYTNIELTFALKEINITLYASKETKRDDQTPSDKYITPTADITTTDMISDFGTSLLDNEKLLNLNVMQIEITMAQRTYELVATVRLGAINLTSFNVFNGTHIILPMIDTPRFKKDLEYLLSISYTNVNKFSPEFMTKYNSTEQLVNVNFSTLQLILHLECLQQLLTIADGMQRKLQQFTDDLPPKDHIASTIDNEGLITKLTTISEDPENPIEPKKQSRRQKEKAVDSVKIKLLANLDQVSVEITCLKRPISSLKVQHLFAGVILKSSYTELTLILKDILVTDLNPYTTHTTILSIVGDNALNCQIVIFNMNETANYNLDDLKISVTMGCVKIIFLNWFVTSLLTFINNFQTAREAIVNASAAAADAAKQNVVDAYEKATRLKLNIKIKAPIIVIPIDSNSLDGICVDLGFLKISNFITEREITDKKSDLNRNPAVFDDIKLELKDMKVSKVFISQDEKSNDVEFVSIKHSLNYGLQSNMNILDPISFALIIKRNLSYSWYKAQPEIAISGRLKSIELNLYVDNYILLMEILNKNLVEGQNEFVNNDNICELNVTETPVQIEVHQPKVDKEITKNESAESKKEITESSQDNSEHTKTNEQLKFNFQFDGIVANLIDGENKGLATFGLYLLSVRGQKLADGTFSTSIVLCDIQLDDNRPSSESKITKYLRRKDERTVAEQNEQENIIEQVKYMLDVVAILKENDTFVEIRVSGFDLIISIDFLMKVVEFFNIPTDENVKTSEIKSVDSTNITQPTKKPVDNSNKKMKIILYVDEPDIILVESLEDTNAYAIIFNAHMNLNYRIVEDKQLVYGEIKELKMYMCAFLPEKREATKHYIIHPCTITLQGSTPQDKGLHISLKMSNLIINISPATIELINKAILTVTTSNPEKALENINKQKYTNIWNVQQYKEQDFWFIKVDKAYDVLDLNCTENNYSDKPEKCIVEIPSIALVFETGIGYYTSPMLYIETKMDISISDWSRKLQLAGSLNLAIQYYNNALAVWEPLIEPNERFDKNGLPEYGPWELKFDLKINSTNNLESEEEIKDADTKIMIHSEDILELTFSKTCFELLQTLGEDFSQAFDIKGLVKPEIIAPYTMENDTGYEISIDFSKSIFTLHEYHMPTMSQKGSDKLSNAVVFQTENSQGMHVNPHDIKSCTISPGGRVYLQTKYLCNMNSDTGDTDEEVIPEYSVKISIGGIQKNIILPVSKADKRYFPLYRDSNQEPWGIISEVTCEYGTTKINIHGVVEVHNHFTTNVMVYRQKQKSERILVGEINPGEVFHVPLHTIYATSKELYFSLPGYNHSIQGIKWNDCLTDLSYNRQIQCDPINTFEPLYISAIREKTEVYYETTTKFTILSAYYTIHLRPPLYLRNALPINIKVSVAGCTVRHDGLPKTTEISEIPLKSANREDFLDYGEKDVKPGDVLHLPTVKLSTKMNEPKNYIVVRLIQYLEKDWSCTTKISENHSEFETWTFTSYDSVAKMDMELGVRFENRHGSLMLTVYSPFWMINKTGLMLSYIKFRSQTDTGSMYKTNTESVNVLYHPPEYNGPILFSFRDKHFFDKKRASIRVDSGDWSEKIPLDVAGSDGHVLCKANDMIYQIGVHIHLTQNSLTKQITFSPFHIAINNCEFAIELQEYNRPGDPWVTIEPNECIPIWPKANDQLLIARIFKDNLTTVPFSYSDIQCTLLKIDNEYSGINVDVQVTEGGIYITFYQYNSGDAPGLIINHTTEEISFWEKGDVNKRILKMSEKVLFTWNNPAGDKMLLWKYGETDLRRDGVGQFKFKASGKSAFWVSFLDGLQRVLLFTETESIAKSAESSASLHKVNQEIEIHLQGLGLSIVNNINGNDLLYLGLTSSGVIWESRKLGKKHYKPMKMLQSSIMETSYQEYLNNQIVGLNKKYYLEATKNEINFKEMKLMKPSHPRDIQRTFYPGVWAQIKTSPFQMQIHAKINRIQIDNQLTDCIFPVVLAPIPPPKSVAATSAIKPFVECSIVQRVVPNSNVMQFKYCSVLIQEFHFKVDLQFLTALADMFVTEISDQQAAKLFNSDVKSIQKPLSELVASSSEREQKNFYDNLHLGPIKIHVSFSMAGSETTALPSILSTIVQGVGVTLTDVHDVVFRLAFFEREYQFFTQQQLVSEIISHYSGQALKQLYVLVLGLDVLGNPFGLVVGIKKGVEDLFYEPFQGAIQGPGEFAEGLVLGVKSLFGHTVGGAAGAVSKITGAMGKGLAALTFDEDYQKKRRQALNKKPANFQEGIARSSKGLVMGVVDGVSGVFTKPISGAKEEGVEGFFKGLGKGAIGLVARPTAGVVDFASGSFDAVKRATANTVDAQRTRPPRFLHFDNILRPYSRNEAKGNKLLKEIDKGKYAHTDTFIFCDEIVENHEVLLISNHRIIYGIKNDLFGHWTVQWTYMWPEVELIRTTDSGVDIFLKKENKKLMGLFTIAEVPKKQIPIPNTKKKQYIVKIMESQKLEILN